MKELYQRGYLVFENQKPIRIIIDKYNMIFYPDCGGWRTVPPHWKIKLLPGKFSEEEMFWKHHEFNHDGFYKRFTKSWLYYKGKANERH